jgi:hypothetical protein
VCDMVCTTRHLSPTGDGKWRREELETRRLICQSGGMSLADLIEGISAENRLLRPYQQDRPVLVLLCGTPCKYCL